MSLPNILITPQWMLMARPVEGLVEYKEEGDSLHTMRIKDHMLKQYRKMLYEYCVKNLTTAKMAEIHNWLLANTGVGL